MSNSLLDETEVFSEAFSNDLAVPQVEGIKFGVPETPLPGNAHLKRRYDPVVEQITNLMMRHGKKGVAQRVRCFSHSLYTVARTDANNEIGRTCL